MRFTYYKKIYINDYIINTTLLDKSLFNLLVKLYLINSIKQIK